MMYCIWLTYFTSFSLIAFEASAEIYFRLPQDVIYGSHPTPIAQLRPTDKYDVIIFPGAGGPDQYTSALQESILRSDKKKGVVRQVVVYDWQQWRGNFLRAAFDSQLVGAAVGGQLAQNAGLKNVHAIGISVGAFAADSCLKTYKSLAQQPSASTHLTLLDPFTSKGPFGYGWGLKNFGLGADVVEDYLNSDDPVPTTNDPVSNAFTLDVTSSQAKRSFVGDSYHSWPVAYLASHWTTEVDEKGDILEPASEKVPKGTVVVVP